MNVLENTNSTEKFSYLIIIIICILFVRRLQLENSTLLGLTAGVALVIFLNRQSQQRGTNFLVDMEGKLNSRELKKTNNFYIDSELVSLMYEIREYRFYNPANYRSLIRTLDNFLQIVKDMEQGTDRMGDMYEIATDLKLKALNAAHAMIYSIPQSSATMKKYQTLLKKLEKLLNFHMDHIYQYMTYAYGKQKINITTKFIYKNQPRPADQSFNQHYNYFS